MEVTDDRLDEHILAQQLPLPLSFHAQLPSTNAWLLRTHRPFDNRFAICDRQTSGYGRFQRPFVMPDGCGVALSLRYISHASHAPLTAFSTLTIEAALACAAALRNYGVAVAVKWPNDLYIDGRKLAGILAETRSDGARHIVVLGIGCNVHPYHTQPDDRTALMTHCTDIPSRTATAIILGNALLTAMQRCEKGDNSDLPARFRVFDMLYGLRVRVHQQQPGDCNGIATGIDANGRLQLQHSDGMSLFSSGDTTIRQYQ